MDSLCLAFASALAAGAKAFFAKKQHIRRNRAGSAVSNQLGRKVSLCSEELLAPLRASKIESEDCMELGMIGLGRMGTYMVQRLMRAGHQCVVYDLHSEAVKALVKEGAVGSASLEEFTKKLKAPRAVWMMVPAGVVDATLKELTPLLEAGDVVIDGGNSYYHDDIRRAAELKPKGIHYVDAGTSGGVWGAERGYCLMIGGEKEVVERIDPIFAALAPSVDSAPRTPGREKMGGTAEHGYLHCGPSGAGHFVKMVHNGIEYGIMAAYAEGLNILHHANAGKQQQTVDAETTPLRNPEMYQYDLNLADIAEVWRRGSVISSWLLDLTAIALVDSPDLAKFAGRVSDSGEGRWTITAAIDESVPAPVLSAALYERFSSRGEDTFADKLLSALRFQFGGHQEKAAGQKEGA
jgi:6-phosphogluconate dehydrogenase